MAEPITPEQRLAEIRDRDDRALSRAEDPACSLSQAEYDRTLLLDEVDRLNKAVGLLGSHLQGGALDLMGLLRERDEAHELLDTFACKVAPVEVIGEHSSGNDPWVNALDMVTPAAEVDRLTSVAHTQAAMLNEITSTCMAVETERDRLKAELAEMESAASDWAARLIEEKGKTSQAESRIAEALDLASRLDPSCGRGRVQAFISDLRRALGRAVSL